MKKFMLLGIVIGTFMCVSVGLAVYSMVTYREEHYWNGPGIAMPLGAPDGWYRQRE